MNYSLQCRISRKCGLWGLIGEDSCIYKMSIEQKGQTGIERGFTGLAKSLAYNVRKFRTPGFITRVHRNELSESGIGIQKKSLPKKLRNSPGEKGYEKVDSKDG
jgi:hypothetical protein